MEDQGLRQKRNSYSQGRLCCEWCSPVLLPDAEKGKRPHTAPRMGHKDAWCSKAESMCTYTLPMSRVLLSFCKTARAVRCSPDILLGRRTGRHHACSSTYQLSTTLYLFSTKFWSDNQRHTVSPILLGTQSTKYTVRSTCPVGWG